MALPTNIDSTFADSASDPSVQAHQQYHDTLHDFYNTGAARTQYTRTASYTLTAADSGADQNMNLAADGTVVLPFDVSGFPVRYEAGGLQVGAGVVTVRRGSKVMDTFTRAQTTTSLGTAETGQAWTNLRGQVAVSASGRASNPAGVADTSARIDTGVTDGFVTAALSAADGGSSLLFRIQDADNFYSVAVASSSYALLKRTAGNFVVLGGTGASTPHTAVDGDVYRVTFVGSTIVVAKNGVQTITATDTTYPAGSTVGLRFDNASSRWDNFEAGPVVAPPLSRGGVYRTNGAGSPFSLWRYSTDTSLPGGGFALTGDLVT